MRNKKIYLLMFLVLLAFHGWGQVQDLYLKGIASSDRGKYKEASEYLEKALSYDDDNSGYLLKLAEIKYKSGDNESALVYLGRLEKEAPGLGSYLQACMQASSGNAGEAVRYLEIHLHSAYKFPSTVILLDDAFTGIENSPEWRSLWSRNWYSEDEQLLQEIRYLNSTGEHLQALEIIDARIEERNDWDAIYAARGDVLLEMKQYQAALQAYTRAIEISSVHPAYYYGRAETFLAQNKLEKAIADLEKVSRMEPENLDLLMEIGRIYRQSGNFDKASSYVNQYIEYYPEEPESLYLLGEIYFDSGKYLDALAQFNACLRLSAIDARFYAARGKTYLKTKTYKYALNDLGMALDLEPDDPEVWYNKGLVRWSMNDREGSLSDWKRAARLGSYEAVLRLKELGIMQ